MLRPFAAVVLPGCDARLGGWPMPEGLLPRAAAALAGIASPEERQRRERLAFAHLLRVAPLTLMRRARDGAVSLAPSRLVEQLRLSLSNQGLALRAWIDPRERVEVAPAPVRRAEAIAPALVPDRLSATALETLRGCPYRFFAHAMLRLNAADEIEAGLDKRDWGNWLHEVLLRFHEGRRSAREPADDAAALHAAARDVLDAHGLDAADFLPWQASFDAFVPRYLAFMRRRDGEGARWQLGEQSFTLNLPEAQVELYGIVDRIDEVEEDGATVLELIDYKAGSQSRWKEQARLGFEDTQLAFYAALVGAATGRPVRAGYLPLESRDTLAIERHKEVEASGRALTEGVAIDIARLRGGAALRALGEGSICEWCDVRGLCRRDDWQAEVQGLADDLRGEGR
jgi:ATP-dependent helicase/nuclease subunit B